MTEQTSAKKDEGAVEARPESFHGPGYAEHYANSCLAAMSQWDIQLSFGRNEDGLGPTRDQKLVKIFLSPMHAKAVARILAQMVQKYEEKFGEIKMQGGTTELDTNARP